MTPNDFGLRPDLNDVVAEVPQLRRGQVWCTRCGHTQKVDSANSLARGWPNHCGYTMTIDSPAEHNAMSELK